MRTTTELPGKAEDELYEFDELPIEWQRGAIVDMLNKLPKASRRRISKHNCIDHYKQVSEMRQYLLRKTPGSVARARQSVRFMRDDVPDAAWTLLRW